MVNLKNKVVIITGSEGDIGRTLVKKFKSLKAKVYGFDIKNGLDITNLAIKEEIDKIGRLNKHIDILINNAGITHSEEIIEVNLLAPYNLSIFVLPYMKHGGSIINITSLWSELGGSNNPLYGMTKGGLKQLTKCLAYDFAPFNIRVNNVGFGYIKTKMTEYSWENRKKEIENRTMLGRWGKPEDVVGLITLLCSDEASYITGQDFYIDGGFLAKGL